MRIQALGTLRPILARFAPAMSTTPRPSTPVQTWRTSVAELVYFGATDSYAQQRLDELGYTTDADTLRSLFEYTATPNGSAPALWTGAAIAALFDKDLTPTDSYADWMDDIEDPLVILTLGGYRHLLGTLLSVPTSDWRWMLDARELNIYPFVVALHLKDAEFFNNVHCPGSTMFEKLFCIATDMLAIVPDEIADFLRRANEMIDGLPDEPFEGVRVVVENLLRELTHPLVEPPHVQNADSLEGHHADAFAREGHTHDEYLLRTEPARTARALYDGWQIRHVRGEFADVDHEHGYARKADITEADLLDNKPPDYYALANHWHDEYATRDEPVRNANYFYDNGQTFGGTGADVELAELHHEHDGSMPGYVQLLKRGDIAVASRTLNGHYPRDFARANHTHGYVDTTQADTVAKTIADYNTDLTSDVAVKGLKLRTEDGDITTHVLGGSTYLNDVYEVYVDNPVAVMVSTLEAPPGAAAPNWEFIKAVENGEVVTKGVRFVNMGYEPTPIVYMIYFKPKSPPPLKS